MYRLYCSILLTAVNLFFIFVNFTTAMTTNRPVTAPKLPASKKLMSLWVSPKTEVPKSYRWTDWEECPQDSFVSGMSLSLQPVGNPGEPFVRDTIKRIKLACGNGSQKEFQTLSNSTNSSIPFGSYRKCPLGSLAVGFQLKQAANFSTARRGIVDFLMYCNDWDNELTRVKETNRNVQIQPAWWQKPIVCAWGQHLCGIRTKFGGEAMDKMVGLQMKCCTLFDIGSGWRNYREVPGKVMSSNYTDSKNSTKAEGDRIYEHHFKAILDYPFYYKWKFCPITTYVTGMQLQYDTRDVRLICSDMTLPIPRRPEYIQVQVWEDDEDKMSDQAICEGAAIGFQIKYDQEIGIQALRLFSSYSKVKGQLPYVEARFKPLANRSHLAVWQEPQLCGPRQALCGFKSLNGKMDNNIETLEHFKAKCCQVPEIADICFPGDNYELLVECDATEALADTTCTYMQSEGVSIHNSKTESERRDQQFHDSLAEDWSNNQGFTNRESHGKALGEANTVSYGGSSSNTISYGQSHTIMDSTVKGISDSTTGTISRSVGKSDSSTNGNSQSFSDENSTGSRRSENFGKNDGVSKSEISGNIQGLTQSGSTSSSEGQSSGASESIAEGISEGFMASRTVGSSRSFMSGTTETQSESDTVGSSNSHSTSSRNSFSGTVGGGVTASAGGGIPGIGSASLEVNFHASATIGTESGEESSQSHHKSKTSTKSMQTVSQQTNERSNQETNQKNKEKSKMETQNRNQEIRRDQSNTKGLERNRQYSQQNSIDKSSQLSKNIEIGSSYDNAHRSNTEYSNQINLQATVENANSTSNLHSLEISLSNQESLTIDNAGSNTSSANFEKSLSSNSQSTVDKTLEKSNSRSSGQHSNRGKSFTTGFDWTKTSSQTWNIEKSHTIAMIVPAGIRAQLYQVVGYCAHFRVKTSKYKRIDRKLNIQYWTEETVIGDDVLVE